MYWKGRRVTVSLQDQQSIYTNTEADGAALPAQVMVVHPVMHSVHIDL